jgi:thioredoxin 1
MNVALAVLLVVVVGLVLMSINQIRMERAGHRQVGRPAPPLSDLPATGAALVWFHSPSCGPCRAMEPAVESLAAGGHTVIAIDVTLRRADAYAWSIAATPTSVFVRDGVITASRVGALPKPTRDALISA